MSSRKITLSSPPSVSAVAREHKISRQTVGAWKAAGLDLSDRKAVAAKVSAMASRSSPDLQIARLAKITAETERIRHAHAVESGRFVDASLVQSTGHQVGQLVRQSLDKLATELPPLLAGHDSATIYKIIKSEFRRVLQDVSERSAASPIKLIDP